MNKLQAFISWGVDHQGPTHSAALIRIALALIIWVRFADEVAFFNALDPLFLPFGAWMLIWPFFAVIGILPRLSIALSGLGVLFGYFMLGMTLNVSGWYHHHVFLIGLSCLLIALTPCGKSWSLARWFELRGARAEGRVPEPETGPLWGLRLIGLQLSAIYFWAAVDKTDWGWVNGERLEQVFLWQYSGRALQPVLFDQTLIIFFSVTVLLVEYALPILIHIRRWQWLVLPAGIGMHIAFYLLLPVDTYSITMIVLYLALLPPDAVTRFLCDMQGSSETGKTP